MSVVWDPVGVGERIVVIDDLRRFVFRATYLRTSLAGLEFLRSGARVDELWLDHDLGVVDGDLDSISPVVDLLLERAVWDDPVDVGVIVIHSDNPPGAEMMVRCLARHYAVRRVNATGYLSVVLPPRT